jgi:FtsP/CotA-like multicopper oxidase with cupredoxin domain
MREENIKLHLWFGTMLLASSSAVPAAELRQPVQPNAGSVSPLLQVPPGCPPVPVGKTVRAASLMVRNTMRPDVGPYRVTLPGYATEQDPNGDHYAPFVIETQPGDTLRVDLHNQLDASVPNDGHAIVNLHMHGVVVSPTPPSGCSPVGDYVFSQTGKGFVTNYRFDIPTKLEGEVGLGQPYYPSGVYWFHSHIHGSARDEVQAGQAGLISIMPGADVTDDPTALARAGTQQQTRYMILRDIQLAVPHGRTPDTAAAAGQTAKWLSGKVYDTQACRKDSNPGVQLLSGHGFCGHTTVYDENQKIVDRANDTVWLFTINGQNYPDVTIQPGETELWRIANLSPTVTYTLELVDGADNERDLQILTMDGVVAGTPSSGSSPSSSSPQSLKPGVTVKHVLLMPAARAEILVKNDVLHAQNISLTLRTQGLETGGVQQPKPPNRTVARPDYKGDPWPAVDLAHVVLKAVTPESASPPQDLLATTFSRALPFINSDRATAAAIPKNCVTLPSPSSQYRRKITFAQDDTTNTFMLGSDVVDSSGRPIDPPNGAHPHTLAPEWFIHADPPESIRHICAQLGTMEVWELVNTTNELHNFHIHQTKFRLARVGDPGAPPNLTDAMVFADPGKVLAGQDLPELVHVSAGADVWHDTIPVPPAKDANNPGRVFVTIPFTDSHQVGTFVFHCHILEHEDSGMMATVQVFDPRRRVSVLTDPGQAPGISEAAAYCGNPPTGFTATQQDNSFSRNRLLASLYRVIAGGIHSTAWK